MRAYVHVCGNGEVGGGGGVGWVLLAQGGGNDICWLGKGKVRASLSVVIFYIHFNAVTLNHSFII